MCERTSGPSVEKRLERIEDTIRVLAWWLVEAQTGFAERDARGVEEFLDGKRKPHWRSAPGSGK
jgi:hypothetical protein